MSDLSPPHFLVITRPAAAGGYVATCPDMPHWSVTGDTRKDAENAAVEIVSALVAHRQAVGIPVVSTTTVTVVSHFPAVPAGEVSVAATDATPPATFSEPFPFTDARAPRDPEVLPPVDGSSVHRVRLEMGGRQKQEPTDE